MLIFFPDFLYKSICCGYSFELHQQVAIQMGTHICCYKVVDKKYTACNLKTMELLDCTLIGVCVVIRWYTVYRIKYGIPFNISLAENPKL